MHEHEGPGWVHKTIQTWALEFNTIKSSFSGLQLLKFLFLFFYFYLQGADWWAQVAVSGLKAFGVTIKHGPRTASITIEHKCVTWCVWYPASDYWATSKRTEQIRLKLFLTTTYALVTLVTHHTQVGQRQHFTPRWQRVQCDLKAPLIGKLCAAKRGRIKSSEPTQAPNLGVSILHGDAVK